MGRGRKKGSSRGERGMNRGDKRRGEDNRVSFDKVPKSNERLERYYNQILNLSDEERSEFWEALKRQLPNSFRFTGSKSHALAVQNLLKERYIPQISEIHLEDGTFAKPPEPIAWYPDELAWWMTTSKSVIRRFPPFAAFQKYLVSETSVGNISRQEAVSMIPPLLMDVRPGMTVLDMCAAPGSKAAQLLEFIHVGEEKRMRKSLHDFAQSVSQQSNIGTDDSLDADLDIDNSDFGRATGLLIANDADYKRSHTLIHQLKRFSSPNLIVTNHDATIYPSIKLPPSPINPSTNRYLKFDRILADVPCSGDGTTRKNVNLWKDWSPGSAIGLHTTQTLILVRALQMLKVGGRVAYSTCSMNPIENEAVISSAIARSGGLSKVNLLSCEEKLPLLKRRQGLRDWSVMDKTGKIWSSWSEVCDAKAKDHNLPEIDKLLPGMFPPIAESPDARIPLENCIRIYAHLQDTGGFFIAILEKLSEIGTNPKSEVLATKNSHSSLSDPSTASSDGGVLKKFDINTNASSAIPNEVTTQISPINDIITKRSIQESNVEVENSITEKKPKITCPLEILKPSEPIEKIRSLAAQTDTAAHLEVSHNGQVSINPKRNKHGTVEEPFKYISNDNAEIQAIESFYKLSPRFPRDRFMVRNAMGQPSKTIYYTSSLIRDILIENEGRGIKFLHGGVKMFMKQDVQGPDVCRWRIQSEGMPILEGYVGDERVVYLTKKETLKKLLLEMFPKVADEAWQELGEIGEQVREIKMGCLVLRVNLSCEEDGITEKMVLPLWRSAASLNLMLAKEDRTAMLLRIFNDSSPLLNHSVKARNAAIEHANKKGLKEGLLANTNEAAQNSENEEIMDGDDNLTISSS